MTECANCGSSQPAGAKFCNSCGAALVTFCGGCGVTLPPGSRFCNECGSPVGGESTPVRSEGATPVASRRITSVLFGDLVGFTPLSESRDQEDVRELLSRYFEECARIVGRYGGVVEKFIGDAVMAVWGVPTTHEDDAERSVRAGLELVAAAAALGAEVGIEDLAMRVGIVTGEVAVTVGAQMQGMVAGDPVNTASRVQSVAASGQVWVDETTRLLSSASVAYADVGSHRLKGKADPMPLWAARAVIATAGGAQRADGLEAPLVGRTRELRMVKELFHGAEEQRRPALLVVSGDAGVGKTRLGWEFSKYTDGLSDPCRWHAGKCVSYGEGVAFYALAEAIRSRLETALDTVDGEPVETNELVDRGLAVYVDDPAERAWLAPRLGVLLGAAGAQGFRRDDLFAAWTTFFERVSHGTEPVVMLVDDAQYADEGLVLFLEHLLAAATFPCFVMLLARPELLSHHAELATNRRASVLHLEPLAPAEMDRLVDGLVAGLPDAVRAELVQRSEGVPTYAVETVRALIDRDLVVPRGGEYVLADPEALDLATIGAPASLHALVSARLDRLTPDERRVVDRASVAGGSVEPALLADLCGDVSNLDQVLVGLVRAQIFAVDHNRLSSEQGRYQFVQSAIRQVAYATLSRRDRKQTHLRLLEAMSGDGSDELAPVAAQHCISAIDAAPEDPDVAELTQRAVVLLRKAARRARELGAPKEAAGHLGRALGLVSDLRDRHEIQLALAEASHDSGRHADAVELAQEARLGFAGEREVDREATAASVQASAMVRASDDFGAAVDLLEPYLRRLQATPGDGAVLGQVLSAYTLVLGRMGVNDFELMFEQIKLHGRLGNRGQVSRAITNFAVALFTIGLEELGLTVLEKGIDVAREAHDHDQVSHGLGNLASGLAQLDAPRAAAVAAEAVEAAQRTGNLPLTSIARVNQAISAWTTGRWDLVGWIAGSETLQPEDNACVAAVAALVLAARGQSPLDVVEASSPREHSALYRDLGVAVGQAFAGDAAASATAWSALKGFHDVSGLYDDFTLFYGATADIALANGDADVLDRLRRILDEDSSPRPTGLEGHRALLGGWDADRVGDPDGAAEASFLAALRHYEAWGSPVHVARAEAAYGVWLTRRGRLSDAHPHVAAARTAYAALDASAWLADLDGALTGAEVIR